jgi:hypothetical protein
MLQKLILEASKDLVKAHLSCADQLDRSPAQHLLDGALEKYNPTINRQPQSMFSLLLQPLFSPVKRVLT